VRLALAKQAALIHLGIRLLMLAAVMIGVAVHPLHTGSFGGDLGAALGKSDGVWYLGIAHHGYGPAPHLAPDGHYPLTSLAFFPLYPMLVRAVAFVGVPYLGAALTVTLVAGTLAAIAITAWARPVLGEPGALLLLAVWELLPSSIVLSMAYSEALFVAAAAGCLLALRHERWLAAGVTAAIACLTRPTGGCLLLAIAVAGWVAIRQHTNPADRRRTGLLAIGAALVCAAGLAISLVHVAVRTRRITGWFWIEHTIWHSGYDAGRSTFDATVQLFSSTLAGHRPPDAVAAVVMVLAVVAIVSCVRPKARVRLSAAEATYAIAVVVLTIGQHGYYYVKPRLLLVAFPLLVPFVGWLRERSQPQLRRLAVVATTLSLAYNCYLVVGWPLAL
jgi:hypothetical protein